MVSFQFTREVDAQKIHVSLPSFLCEADFVVAQEHVEVSVLETRWTPSILLRKALNKFQILNVSRG